MVGVTVNDEPEQIAAVCALVTIGKGFTVNVNVLGVPEQAGPYVNTTAKDFGVPIQGSPKVAVFAGIDTVL